MQTNIHYRDVARTEHLEAYLLDRIEGLADKFLHDDLNAHLMVKVEEERHRSEYRKPVFTCEVVLKPSHTRRILKVKKSGTDFYECVSDLVDAFKNVLAKHSSKMNFKSSRKERRLVRRMLNDLSIIKEAS